MNQTFDTVFYKLHWSEELTLTFENFYSYILLFSEMFIWKISLNFYLFMHTEHSKTGKKCTGGFKNTIYEKKSDGKLNIRLVS